MQRTGRIVAVGEDVDALDDVFVLHLSEHRHADPQRVVELERPRAQAAQVAHGAVRAVGHVAELLDGRGVRHVEIMQDVDVGEVVLVLVLLRAVEAHAHLVALARDDLVRQAVRDALERLRELRRAAVIIAAAVARLREGHCHGQAGTGTWVGWRRGRTSCMLACASTR